MLVLFIVAVVVLVILFGPRPRVDLAWAERSLPTAFNQLPEWLLASEQAFANITEGAEKRIDFADGDNPSQTPLVVLYLHGFSATRQEISPVPERVAKALGANYYGARLSGHGQGSEALGNATAEQWVSDAIEAWQVASALGDRVIIISCSTGGTLATWLAQQPEVQANLAGLIFFAPNFQIKQWAGRLFTWPWAHYWLPLVVKKEHSWEPAGELNGKYWTYRYSTRVIHELQALIDAVRNSPVERIKAPSLFIYSDDDQVVEPRAIKVMIDRWGGAVKQSVLVPGVPGESNHVITGDIVAPLSTQRSIEQILGFLEQQGIGGMPHHESDTALSEKKLALPSSENDAVAG